MTSDEKTTKRSEVPRKARVTRRRHEQEAWEPTIQPGRHRSGG